MRLAPTLTSGLSAAAALVLLTACGGSDTEEPAASATSAGSSAAATSSAPASEDTSADPDAEAFCTEAQAVFTDVESAGADPAALPSVLAEASERISAIEAPAEISASWDTLTQAFAGIVADTQDLDLSTPEGQAAFTTALGSLQGEAAQAQTEVQTYVQANCDLATTAPTS